MKRLNQPNSLISNNSPFFSSEHQKIIFERDYGQELPLFKPNAIDLGTNTACLWQNKCTYSQGIPVLEQEDSLDQRVC